MRNIATEQEVLELYQHQNALWSFDYNGDPKAPHAEWTGGLCSDGYTNSRLVLSDPRCVAELASMLIQKARTNSAWRDPNWVIGSAYAAITISYEVARQLGAKHGFVKKSATDPKVMVWDQLVIHPGEMVLQCEELIATNSTTTKVRRAIIEGNPNPVRFFSEVLTIIHYPKVPHTGPYVGTTSLATRKDIKVWRPEICPMCLRGSPRIRPAEHWAELTGQR